MRVDGDISQRGLRCGVVARLCRFTGHSPSCGTVIYDSIRCGWLVLINFAVRNHDAHNQIRKQQIPPPEVSNSERWNLRETFSFAPVWNTYIHERGIQRYTRNFRRQMSEPAHSRRSKQFVESSKYIMSSRQVEWLPVSEWSRAEGHRQFLPAVALVYIVYFISSFGSHFI